MDAISDFRFLLPLQAGQSVAVFGCYETLVQALRDDKINVSIYNEGIPSGPCFDHILIPRLTREQSNRFPHEFARLLRPNGTIFVGFANRVSIDRLFVPLSGVDSALYSLGRFRKFLQNSGLSLHRSYGIRDLERPQFVVSLDQPFPSRFFFAQMFYPHSIQAAFGRKVSNCFASLGLHRFLFKYFGVVAVKKSPRKTND